MATSYFGITEAISIRIIQTARESDFLQASYWTDNLGRTIGMGFKP